MSGEGKTCSFCGVTWSPEHKFLGGFGAFICGACATRAATVLNDADEFAKIAPPTPPWEKMTDEELIATLPEIVRNADQVETFLHGWVGLLRERGISWQRIGLALGVSRQAAWERFTRVNKSLAKRDQHA